MRDIPSTSRGTAAITAHAPLANLAADTTTSTNPVVVAPIALMAIERRHLPVRSRHQRRTIEVWLRVNDTNTPTTYNWISRDRVASNTTMRAAAATERMTMPLLYTRRSPRLRIWRGIRRSPARIADSRGKSW